jgi:hypothetical protein
MSNLSCLGFHGFDAIINNHIGSKNQNSIPKSRKGRLPQSLKEWMRSPCILSLENHSFIIVQKKGYANRGLGKTMTHNERKGK